jgi:O-antigen ligase
VGGAALAILVAMLYMRMSLAAVAAAVLLAGVGLATILYPEVGLYALVLNALVGFTHVRELPRLGPLSIPIAFELILVVAVAVQVALGRRRLFLGSPQHLLVAGLTFWLVVSLLVSGNVTEENYDAVRNLYLVRILIFFLLTNIVEGVPALKRLALVFAVSNLGLLVTSTLARLGYFGEEKVYIEQKMLRTQGLVHNPNNLAFDLTTMLILAVLSLFYVKRRALKGILFLLALADGAVILSTLSRSGFISLVAVLLFMFVKLTRSARAVAVSLILAVLAGSASQTNLVQRFQRLDAIKDVDRWRLSMIGLNAAVANPVFGVGFGNFIREFDRYNDQDVRRALPTHNMYMDMAAQTGFPGLLLYLAAMGITWRRSRRMERELAARGEERSFLGLFNLGMQCFLVNLAVFGLSGDVEFEYSIFVMLGAAILVHREHLRGRAAPSAPAPEGA